MRFGDTLVVAKEVEGVETCAVGSSRRGGVCLVDYLPYLGQVTLVEVGGCAAAV